MTHSSVLYLTTVLIWGSTFYAIKLQLGVVDPLVSVGYRFLLAGLVLLVVCRWKGLNLRFNAKQHAFMLLQGICLFGLNYWLMYWSTGYLTSGLIALSFSTIVVMNIINGALFLGQPIRREVVIGALLGLLGMSLVFQPGAGFSWQGEQGLALLLVLLGTYCASLGNITSAHTQRLGLSVIQSNAFGMSYGGLLMLGLALASGKTLTFDFSLSYIGSLLYLTLFGSIIAFGSYLTLIGRIGADRAAYTTLLFPLVALGLSTLMEGYQWHTGAVSGLALILLGNLIILLRPSRLKRHIESKAQTGAEGAISPR